MNGMFENVNFNVIFTAVLFVLLDVITGILKGVKKKTLDSTKMREGLFNKVMEIFAIFFGYFCEFALPQIGVNIEISFGSMFSTYIVFMELCSIIENIGEISPVIGKMLSVVFKKLKEEQLNDIDIGEWE